ncbi:MAG: UPF0175 family protein [Calothrix sp. MO_192.B10]|nr:UPF0175 family protein [Calothrix sp. MO_192.B10]
MGDKEVILNVNNGLSKRGLFLEIVLMLFRQDKISLGKASELMGMHRM